MQHFKIHKDLKPQETIRIIRSIMEKLGVDIQEVQWSKFGKNCHSVRIEDMSYNNIGAPAVGTNGKGVSPLYALASAYAEYMERFQNDLLYGRQYGLMKNADGFYPDEIEIDAERFFKKHDIFKDVWGLHSKDKYIDIVGTRVSAVPFYNITKGEVDYLPDRFIRANCGSNGLCAGNTPEEAILQGICEIFERYAIRQIYYKDISVPNIPLSAVQHMDIASMIREIEQKGYKVVIKDCSFGGTYPVTSVTSYNDGHNYYRTTFAADPIQEVAIQRCLTEHYQGLDDASLVTVLLPTLTTQEGDLIYPLTEHEKRGFQHYKCWTGNNGRMPESYLNIQKGAFNSDAFVSVFSDHRTILKRYLTMLINNGYDVFIRDVSFTGFPSYKIYIPGLSETHIHNEQYYSFLNKISRFRAILLKLASASEEDIVDCAKIIEEMITLPEVKYLLLNKPASFFPQMTNIALNKSSHFNDLEPTYLLALLYHRLGDYHLAYKHFRQYLSYKGHTVNNTKYALACLTYFNLKSLRCTNPEIINNLRDTFGEEMANEVVADLCDPKDAFKYLILPQCGNCSECPVSSDCCYPIWSTINDNYRRVVVENTIDQSHLSAIIS